MNKVSEATNSVDNQRYIENMNYFTKVYFRNIAKITYVVLSRIYSFEPVLCYGVFNLTNVICLRNISYFPT